MAAKEISGDHLKAVLTFVLAMELISPALAQRNRRAGQWRLRIFL
jgi:hypothetical protein